MKTNYLRVSLSTPATKIGNVAYNYNEIIKVIDNLKNNDGHIHVFPRLGLTSASCEDFIYNNSLQDASLVYLNNLVKHCKDINKLIMVGLPFNLYGKTLDCVAVIYSGAIMGLSTISICNNDFSLPLQQLSQNTTINIAGHIVPCGDIIYDIDNKVKLKIIGGDDSFDTMTAISYATKQGVNLIINLQSSYACLDFNLKQGQLSMLSKQYGCAIINLSNNAQESSYGNIYNGQKLVVENGEVIKSSMLDYDLNIDCDIDWEYIVNNNSKNICNHSTGFNNNLVSLGLKLHAVNTTRQFEPLPYVAPISQYNYILDIIATAIYTKMQELSLKKVIFGLSGGLDSTMTLLSCMYMCNKYNLSSQDIMTVTMSGFGSSSRTKNNAKALAATFKTTLIDIDIKKSTTQHLQDINHTDIDVVYENAQARERTQILLDLANKHYALHLGTGDLSEIALGFSTFGGDQLAQFNTNNSLTKTQIKALIGYLINEKQLNSNTDKLLSSTITQLSTTKTLHNKNLLQLNTNQIEILKDILSTPISPELKKGQETELILGSYELHDYFLYHLITRGSTVVKVYANACNTYKNISKLDIKNYLELFIKRFFINQFKRKYAADGIQVFKTDLSTIKLNTLDPNEFLNQLKMIDLS